MKVGIVADNWKVPMFQEALNKAGFKFKEHAGKAVTSFIVECESKDVARLNAICAHVQSVAFHKKQGEN